MNSGESGMGWEVFTPTPSPKHSPPIFSTPPSSREREISIKAASMALSRVLQTSSQDFGDPVPPSPTDLGGFAMSGNPGNDDAQYRVLAPASPQVNSTSFAPPQLDYADTRPTQSTPGAPLRGNASATVPDYSFPAPMADSIDINGVKYVRKDAVTSHHPSAMPQVSRSHLSNLIHAADQDAAEQDAAEQDAADQDAAEAPRGSACDLVQVVASGQRLYLRRSDMERMLGITDLRSDPVDIPDVDSSSLLLMLECLQGRTVGAHASPLEKVLLSNAEIALLFIAASKYQHDWIALECMDIMESQCGVDLFICGFKLIYDASQATEFVRDRFKKDLKTCLQWNLDGGDASDGWLWHGKVLDVMEYLTNVASEGGAVASDLAEVLLKRGIEQPGDPRASSTSNTHPEARSHQQGYMYTGTGLASSNVQSNGWAGPSCEPDNSAGKDCWGTSKVELLDSHSDWAETAPPGEAEEISRDGWNDDAEDWRPKVHWDLDNTFHTLDGVGRPSAPSYEDEWGRAAIPHNISWDETVSASEVANDGRDTAVDTRDYAGLPASEVPASNTARVPPPPGYTRPTPIGKQPDQVAAAKTSRALPPSAPEPPSKSVHTKDMPPGPPSIPWYGQKPIAWPPYHYPHGYLTSVHTGNGRMHPTAPGLYGLAGESHVALRDSDHWECDLFFRSGDVITNVVAASPDPYSDSTFNSSLGTGRLQGICRGRAGTFPSHYVRTANDPAPYWSAPAFPPSVALSSRFAVSTAPRAKANDDNGWNSTATKSRSDWAVTKRGGAGKWRQPTVNDEEDGPGPAVGGDTWDSSW